MLQLVLHHLQDQRAHGFLWAPVFLGVGIAVYFNLRVEPPAIVCTAALAGAVAGVVALRWVHPEARIIVMGGLLILGGFGLAGTRAHWVAEPVLSYRYYGPIEGRIVKIDRSQSGAMRLTLDRVVLERFSPNLTPRKVRVSLHGDQGFIDPAPGQVVLMTGHLTPPSGPVEPGGFDFQRMAWFDGLGAVGYTRTPVVLGRAADAGAGVLVYRARMAISHGVQARIDGEAGAFAAAIMTGDRADMGAESLDALRASNLAHLLAISGMHMGILVGFIFALVRYGLALWPWVALRVPTKKIAAIAALLVGAVYLVLSGGSVSAQRAFIMVAVMLVAILCDRRALTLRAVALAALIVLALRPDALFGPGFQMSFAATTALVAAFGVLRQFNLSSVPKWVRSAGAVFLSSLVAGAATAPIAAFHFNQIAQFGLIANLLSVPLMGTLVMPAAVLATVLAPLGLADLGLWVMGLGLSWILSVAHFVANLEGGLRYVVTPNPVALICIAIGALGVVLWRGSFRWSWIAPVITGFLMWQIVERPALLVADSGSLIGVMTPDGRAVSKERGEAFAVSSWLENDGNPVPQEVAFNRPGLQEHGRIVRARVGDFEVINIRGAKALESVKGCAGADVLITNQAVTGDLECDVFDITRLHETGALAGRVDDGTLTLISVRDRTGDRLWNTPEVRRRQTPQTWLRQKLRSLRSP